MMMEDDPINHPQRQSADTRDPTNNRINFSLDEIISQSRTKPANRIGTRPTTHHRASLVRGGRIEKPVERRTRQSGGRDMARGKWEHDLFEERRGPVNSSSAWQEQRRKDNLPSFQITIVNDQHQHGSFDAQNTPGTKVTVSNLHHEVTKDDVGELFSTTGPLKRVHLYYDRAGRSNGIADVTFLERKDAYLAIERFHGVPLDGQPMRVELAVATAALDQRDRDDAADTNYNRNNGSRMRNRPTTNYPSAYRHIGNLHRDQASHRNKRYQPRQPHRSRASFSSRSSAARHSHGADGKDNLRTAADLDADLDQYINAGGTSSNPDISLANMMTL